MTRHPCNNLLYKSYHISDQLFCHKLFSASSPPALSTTDMFHKGCAPVRDVLGCLRNKLWLHGSFHATVLLFLFTIWLAEVMETLACMSYFPLFNQDFSCLTWCLCAPAAFVAFVSKLFCWSRFLEDQTRFLCLLTTNIFYT